MPIKVGDRLPNAKFRVTTADGPAWKTTDEIFKGKKVALFAVPGAFTGTCHKQHMPSFVQNAAGPEGQRRGHHRGHRGERRIGPGCLEKGDQRGRQSTSLPTASADFAKAIDLTLDLTGNGMGTRSKRYSMLVDDGVVKTAQCRGAGQVRGLRRRQAGGADLMVSSPTLIVIPDRAADRDRSSHCI